MNEQERGCARRATSAVRVAFGRGCVERRLPAIYRELDAVRDGDPLGQHRPMVPATVATGLAASISVARRPRGTLIGNPFRVEQTDLCST